MLMSRLLDPVRARTAVGGDDLAPDAPHCDYLCESSAPVTPPSPGALFAKAFSARRSMQNCTVGWMCNLADCPSCGERVAQRAQNDALARFADFPWCVSVRLSVELSADLDAGRRDLDRVRTSFLETVKLRHTSKGYHRSTEITRVGARWNWHDHIVVIPLDNTLDDETSRLLRAWEDACRQHDLTPSTHNQISETASALTYITKPRLGRGERSLRDLIDRAAQGDADAVDDWIEWDRWRLAHPRVRLRSSWVSSPTTAPSPTAPKPRNQHVTGIDPADFNRLSLLIALGVTTAAEQADILGTSLSTTKRRRRHLPDSRPGLVPVMRD